MESKHRSAWADLGVLAAILLGAALASGAIAMAASSRLDKGPLMLLTYMLPFLLAIPGGILWLRYGNGGGSTFRLHLGVRWFDALLILAATLLVNAAGIVIEPLLSAMPAHYLEKLNEMIGSGGWAIVTTVVAAPILEEIFFRGLVLESLARRWNARWAVLGSAAVFGLMHLPILPQMVNAFVMAIVMGYIYLISRSLIPVIVIHAINNGLAYIALELWGTQNTDTREWIGNDTLYSIVYAASAVVLVASLIVMDAKVRTKKVENTLNEKTADE